MIIDNDKLRTISINKTRSVVYYYTISGGIIIKKFRHFYRKLYDETFIMGQHS